MIYTIIQATLQDLPMIYNLFEDAMLFQKQNNYIGWKSYDKNFVLADIENKLLYKILLGNNTLCIFSICHHDELIWREKENGDAVYLHRVVLNQCYKGEKVFMLVLEWTKNFAQERKLKFIRMDTWADNEKLITYYKTYGFKVIENYTTPDSTQLPLQHRNLKVALLELKLA
jgi:hypothetical protein